MDLGAPTSYVVLEPGASAYTSDEQLLGEVRRVLADTALDIFDGLVVATSSGERYVEAAQVDEIFEQGVLLRLSASEAAELAPPRADQR